MLSHSSDVHVASVLLQTGSMVFTADSSMKTRYNLYKFMCPLFVLLNELIISLHWCDWSMKDDVMWLLLSRLKLLALEMSVLNNANHHYLTQNIKAKVIRCPTRYWVCCRNNLRHFYPLLWSCINITISVHLKPLLQDPCFPTYWKYKVRSV